MRAIVVGGGIGGLTAAVALRRAGVEAVVFEKAGELREIGAGISLWANAMKALQKLGLYEAVLAVGKPLRPKGELRSPNGEVFYEVPAAAMEERFGDVTAVVHRADLQKALHTALGEEVIRLGVEFTGFEQDIGGVVARFAGGREERCDLLIGADGLHSVVRRQLLDDGPLLYAGYVAWRGVAELGDEPFPGGGRSRRGAGASGLGWSSSGGGGCTGTPQRTRRRGKRTRVPGRDVKRNCLHAPEVGTSRSLQS